MLCKLKGYLWDSPAFGKKTGAQSNLLGAYSNYEGNFVDFRALSKVIVSLPQYGDQSLRIRMQKATPPNVVGRGLIFALIVGTVITAINQGDILASNAIAPGILLKILLNYCVPYFVSTYADLKALDCQQRE